VHQLFIDFKKGYDSVRRRDLHNILIEFRISRKLLRLIKMCLNETYNRGRVDKYLPDPFPIKNDVKKGDALSSSLFNIALEYANRKVKENQECLKLYGTYQLLVYADDVNILGTSMHTRKKNIDALIVASKEICLEVHAEKTKYMVISRDQNAGHNHNIKIENNSFERVEIFKYLEHKPKESNSIHEAIKSRL
jgi:hypothetical protein